MFTVTDYERRFWSQKLMLVETQSINLGDRNMCEVCMGKDKKAIGSINM